MASGSVIDLSLRAIRNYDDTQEPQTYSVIDLSLRAIRNRGSRLMLIRRECNRPQPASNPQRIAVGLGQLRECNRPQPASNPQHFGHRIEGERSVIDLSLRAIRNHEPRLSHQVWSVIDLSLRAIRNLPIETHGSERSVIDLSLRAIRNILRPGRWGVCSVIDLSLRAIRNNRPDGLIGASRWSWATMSW